MKSHGDETEFDLKDFNSKEEESYELSIIISIMHRNLFNPLTANFWIVDLCQD